jgi:hypothetical protein
MHFFYMLSKQFDWFVYEKAYYMYEDECYSYIEQVSGYKHYT